MRSRTARIGLSLALAAVLPGNPVARADEKPASAAVKKTDAPGARSQRLRAWKRPKPLTEEQEAELLEAVRKHSPADHERIVKLKASKAGEYRHVLRRMWLWYQQWKGRPEEVRQAYWTLKETRAEASELVRRAKNAKTKGEREKLSARLRQVVAREFDAWQVIRKYQLAQFATRIEQLEAELKERADKRDKIIRNRTAALLTKKCSKRKPATAPAARKPPQPVSKAEARPSPGN